MKNKKKINEKKPIIMKLGKVLGIQKWAQYQPQNKTSHMGVRWDKPQQIRVYPPALAFSIALNFRGKLSEF